MTDEFIGRTIGGYEIQRLLGQGGMARVYLARQQSMNRQVAIKILPRQYRNDDTYLQRFEREVRIVSQLEHRNIVPVYDYGEYDGMPYIVMRYMPSGSVDDLLRQGALPPDIILSIISQIAPALDYAHSREVLHRDLKPSNVLMDDNGGAYITDFGIARLTDGQGAAITTQGVVGTPSYMSPEQAQGKPLDGRSDLYSLGVMLFEMATGRRPFENDTPYSIAVMQVTTPPPPPRSINPNVTTALEIVIFKSLRKNAADRYQTAAELLEALKMAIERPVSPHDTEPAIKKAAPQPPMIVQAQPVIIQASPAQPVQSPPLSAVQPAPVRQTVYQTPQPQIPPQASVAIPPYGLRSRIRHRRQTSPVFAVLMGGTIGCGLLTIIAIIALFVLSALGILNPVSEGTPESRVATLTLAPVSITTNTNDVSATPGPENTLLPLNQTAEAFRATLEARSTQQVTSIPTPGVPQSSASLLTGTPALSASLRDVSGILIFAGVRTQDDTTSFEIVRLDLKTWQETLLTHDNSDDSYPVASPDGQWVVFQSDQDGDFEIYVMDINGGQVTQLTENDQIDRLASWSPDGDWLIFSSDVRKDGNYDLYRVRRDGSDFQPVYSSAERKSHARYSPDGRYIVFTSGSANDANDWEIMLLDTQTGDVKKLTDNDRRDASPLFSPDGQKILFTTVVSGSNAIATMNLDGSDVRIVYDSGGSEWSAAYSPDGRYIAFSSNMTGSDQIYLMTAAGTDAQQISAERGGYPSWIPGT